MGLRELAVQEDEHPRNRKMIRTIFQGRRAGQFQKVEILPCYHQRIFCFDPRRLATVRGGRYWVRKSGWSPCKEQQTTLRRQSGIFKLVLKHRTGLHATRE